MALKLTTAVQNARLEAINTAVGTSGVLKIYGDTQPTDANTAVGAQTLLSVHAMSATAFITASGGTMSADTIGGDDALATDTATWFRLETSGGTAIMDGTVGTGSEDLVLNTAAIVIGVAVTISSFVLTAGND